MKNYLKYSLGLTLFILVALIGMWKIQCKMPPKTKKILPPENIQ